MDGDTAEVVESNAPTVSKPFENSKDQKESDEDIEKSIAGSVRDEEETEMSEEEDEDGSSGDKSIDGESINGESNSDEDESYQENSEDEGSVESSSSTLSYAEVPDAFAGYIAGPNDIEVEEKGAERLFEKAQQFLCEWDEKPNNFEIRDAYFDCIHDLMLNPSFVRMRKNPYTLDWNSARRMETRLPLSPMMKVFYATHFQLTKLAHNSIPHYLQMLVYTPSRINLWYELGGKSVELGDWKNAEFAYRKYMAFSGEKTKALQNILLLHFVSGDFLKTIAVLKDLLTYQPNNAVARVIAGELTKIKGPWSDHIEALLIQFGASKSHISLTEDKIDWVLKRVQKFRDNLKPKCQNCNRESKQIAQRVHHLYLDEKDVLFYHFGNHLLELYDAVAKSPNALIFIGFPMREEFEKPAKNVDQMEIDLPTENIKSIEEANKEVNEELNEELNEFNKEIAETVEMLVNHVVHDIELPDLSDNQIKEISMSPKSVKSSNQQSPKTPPKPSMFVNRLYLQVVDFLKELASEEQLEKPKKDIHGFYRLAAISDQLLAFVVKKCTAEELKRHKADCQMFRRLYQRWCKLIKCSKQYESDNLEAIHLFAFKIGSSSAMSRLDKIARRIIESSKESNNVSMKSSHQNHNALIFNSNALSEISLRPNSPTFDRMLQVFENLKTTHHSHNNENLCVDTTLELNDDVRTLHLLSLYFPKFELTSDFDLNPPNYLEQARFDAKFDVFFTLGLSNMTTTDRCFLVVYHLEKAKTCRSLVRRDPMTVKMNKITEYRHLTTSLKILDSLIDAYLSINTNFRTEIQTYQQFEENTEIAELMSLIPLTFERLELATKRVVDLCKDFKREQLDNVIIQFEQGEVSEVNELINLFKTYDKLDGYSETKLVKLFSLYKCYKLDSNVKEMYNTIIWILDNLLKNSEIREDFLLNKLDECLNEIDTNLTLFSQLGLEELFSILKDLTEKSYYRTRTHLWITFYKVARYSDPESRDEFCDLFKETEDIDHRLPTKSLMLLKKAHGILSEEKCCMKDQGRFLQFYLDELLEITHLEMVQDALNDSNIFVDDICRKVDKEIMQILNCLYNLELPTRIAKSHEHLEPTPVFRQLDWPLCERILPLFLPDYLPTLSEKNNLSAELNELLNKFQQVIGEPLTEELKAEFEHFLDVNKDYRPNCQFNENNDSFELSSIHNGVDLLNWPYPKDVSLARRELSAKVLFLLVSREFKIAQSVDDEKATAIRRMAKNALMFGSDTLDSDLSTIWQLIAVNMNYILKESDVEIFRQMGQLFLPNYMAILMHKTLAETHLDLATVFFKLVTRFRRYLANSSNTESRNEIELTIPDLLSKASVHFKLAHVYRNDNYEVGWSSSYFMGKIKEKQNAPLVEVIESYQQCAQLMEKNFQFLKKVSKMDQNDFEPLELYYCIHSFLDKQRRRSMENGDFCELRRVVKCLELFAEKHISRNDDRTENFYVDFRLEFEQVKKLANEELFDGRENISEIDSPLVMRKFNLMKKYNNEAEELCCHAFEKILSLFPHYKAAYRLAKQMADYKNYRDAADLLFKDIFPSKGEINENSSIFKNFIEINNQSFYFESVLNYHMYKIICLLNLCFEKIGDLKRVAYVMNSLLKLYNQKNKKLNLSNEVIYKLIDLTKDSFGNAIRFAFGNNATFTAETDPLYSCRKILFEIDKQLLGSPFPFAKHYHETMQIMQGRWVAYNPAIPNY